MFAPMVMLSAVLAQPVAPSTVGNSGVAGAVQLRGQIAPISGEIAGISYAGVLFKTAAEDSGKLISWDRVRAVDGAAGANAAAFLPFADALMRARARLERGDTWLADQAIEPLYQQAVAAGGGGTSERFVGPSGLLLAECGLRSSLERNATASATLAWLQWSAVDRQRPKETGKAIGSAAAGSRGPQWVGGVSNLPPVVDAATGLCPRLPPIFPRQGSSSAGTLRVLTQSAQLKRLCQDGSAARGFAVPYALAARIAAGDVQSGETAALPAPANDAEQLVSDIVAAQTAPGELTRAARVRLQRRLELIQRDVETRETAEESDVPADRTWQRAWLHAAIGRSLLAEDQRALRRQGLVELLHVPAIDGETQPMLAATAILDVIDQLRREGEGSEEAIAALSAELRTRFGVDPAVVTPEPIAPPPVAPAPAAPADPTPPMPPSNPATPPLNPPSKEAP